MYNIHIIKAGLCQHNYEIGVGKGRQTKKQLPKKKLTIPYYIENSNTCLLVLDINYTIQCF